METYHSAAEVRTNLIWLRMIWLRFDIWLRFGYDLVTFWLRGLDFGYDLVTPKFGYDLVTIWLLFGYADFGYAIFGYDLVTIWLRLATFGYAEFGYPEFGYALPEVLR